MQRTNVRPTKCHKHVIRKSPLNLDLQSAMAAFGQWPSMIDLRVPRAILNNKIILTIIHFKKSWLSFIFCEKAENPGPI
jgi:hypothetical protein